MCNDTLPAITDDDDSDSGVIDSMESSWGDAGLDEVWWRREPCGAGAGGSPCRGPRLELAAAKVTGGSAAWARATTDAAGTGGSVSDATCAPVVPNGAASSGRGDDVSGDSTSELDANTSAPTNACARSAVAASL